MSTAEFAARPVADANPPVPICSPLWDEEALSNGCQSAGSTPVISARHPYWWRTAAVLINTMKTC
jgi:hypothetical protein